MASFGAFSFDVVVVVFHLLITNSQFLEGCSVRCYWCCVVAAFLDDVVLPDSSLIPRSLPVAVELDPRGYAVNLFDFGLVRRTLLLALRS